MPQNNQSIREAIDAGIDFLEKNGIEPGCIQLSQEHYNQLKEELKLLLPFKTRKRPKEAGRYKNIPVYVWARIPFKSLYYIRGKKKEEKS
jgi:hypothetical protein